ncbi:unnamed protein product [Mytilus edulis]|uniref:COR domain-containing protein n=1 Tax=Mytilus edulis TaxID=6550 RepID=A0A8S3SVR1_MYTED|nr:unnamed protein product [Mytilus edulis]
MASNGKGLRAIVFETSEELESAYQCKASNIIGSVESPHVQLNENENNEIDHDLARLIQQVYTERKENKNEASEQNIEHTYFGQRNSSFSSDDSKAGINQALVLQKKMTNDDQMTDPHKRAKRQNKFKKNLFKILKQQQKEHLRNIYFVSNIEDDDLVFDEIRKEISSHAMTMKDWGRDCPLKWLLFQQVIARLKDSQVSIATTTNLLTIAKHDSIGIHNDDEFKRCLQYFNDIGTVIYFDEENLKDHVILDSKWLIDAFRCLVSDKIEFSIERSNDWQKLRETGELTSELICLLFRKEPTLKFLENEKHLLEVMKRFDIIVKLLDSNALYMPCMMDSCSFNKVKKKLMNKNQIVNITSWLCLEFEFLPPAFFNHILAWYIKNYPVSAIFEKGTRTNRKALYRQIGVFDLDHSRCQQLVVCEGPNVIAIQVWDTLMAGQQFGNLAEKLFEFVNNIEKRYSLKISYTKSFKCKNGDFNINRRRMHELITEEYRCLEHTTNHVSADLVRPWGFIDDLE